MKKDTKDIVECTQKTSSETNSNSFMKVFNNSKDALLIISGNDFIECNKSAVRLLNAKSKNDVLATHPSQLSPKKQPDGMESYKKANEMMSIAYQKGFHRFEWVHEKLTGEVFPVEVSLTAIEYDNKLVLYTLWKDLTEKKKREKQLIVSSNKLKHSEARFRELFNNMDSGVAIYEAIDNGNNFVMKKINDSGCALSNVTRKNVLGKCITESFPAVNEFGLLKILQEVHRTGQSCRLPATFYKDEKLARWFENFVYKLPSGEIIAIYDDKTKTIY